MKTSMHQNNKIKDFEEAIELLKALAHPKRLKIIDALSQRHMLNVTQLTKILDISQVNTSQHLFILKKTALNTERRGSAVYYFIENPKVNGIIEILKNP